MTQKRRLKAVTQKKEKVLKIKNPQPLLHEDNLLKHSLHAPTSLKEFMLEEPFQPPTASCNMMSIILDGNPRSQGIPQQTPMPQGAMLVIDWSQNTVTYQDHYKGVTIPMAVYRYNTEGISIALTSTIQEPPLRSARITHFPMTP